MDASFSPHQPDDTAFSEPVDTLVQPGERPAILHTVALNSDNHDQQLAAVSDFPSWLDFARQRWRWLCLGGVAFIALLATAALVNTKADNLQGTQTPTAPDQQALLQSAAADFDVLNTQVELQLDETYERLIDSEAVRFLREAEEQVLDASQACYRYRIACVLDQFEQDAFEQYQKGADTLNQDLQLAALLRIAIVDRARTNLKIAEQPDNAITLLALQKRLEARQLARAATAEGMAQSIIGDQ